MKIVIDTNKIFSAIISKNGHIRETLFSEKNSFIAPHFSLIELFKYKEKISALLKKPESEVLEIMYFIFLEISFLNEKSISLESKQLAYDFCKDIDLKDITFVALSIELNAPLWTGDKKLIQGLKSKGFNNFFEDII